MCSSTTHTLTCTDVHTHTHTHTHTDTHTHTHTNTQRAGMGQELTYVPRMLELKHLLKHLKSALAQTQMLQL